MAGEATPGLKRRVLVQCCGCSSFRLEGRWIPLRRLIRSRIVQYTFCPDCLDAVRDAADEAALPAVVVRPKRRARIPAGPEPVTVS